MFVSRCRQALPSGNALRPGIAFLALALLVAPPARGAAPTGRLDLTTAQWREDLRAFATQLPKRHAQPFHFMTREAFDREVASLDSAIAGLDGPTVLARLTRIAAMVGDGHTRINIPPALLSFYPLGLRNFGNQIRVIRTAAGADSALGMRLVSIDDTPVAEALSRVDRLQAQDELPGLREAQAPGYLTNATLLHGVGVVRDERRARVTFQDDGGAPLTLTLAPVTLPPADVVWHLTSPEVPLYRRNRTEALAFTWLEESRTVYCNFRNYQDLGDRAAKLFAFVDQHPVDRLVIDMRQNGGGDFYEGRSHLVNPIRKRPAIDRAGHLFVIVGPITFSAALANAIDFRNQTHAMLVGEPIGEKPNSWSENDEFTLPNSRLKVSYSTKFYEFAPGQQVITPDRVIVPTWEEFRAGRDPVLEWILGCCR
jgi:hypothetical protein